MPIIEGKPILDEWMEDKEFAKGLFEEEFILDVTENILEQMEKKGISRLDLANRLGRTKCFVSQLLNGTRNMTLRTLADIAYAINVPVVVRFDSENVIYENISCESKEINLDENSFTDIGGIWEGIQNSIIAKNLEVNHAYCYCFRAA